MGELGPVESAGGITTHTQSNRAAGAGETSGDHLVQATAQAEPVFIAGKETVPELPRITALVIDQPQDWQGWR